MEFLGKLQKFSHILALPNPKDNDLAYCEERREYYYYSEKDKKWKKRKIQNKPIEVSLYDLNKSFYASQKEPATDEEKVKYRELINEFCKDTKNKYYMMLCKDISYFTILKDNNQKGDEDFADLGQAVIELIAESGWSLLDAYKNEDTDAIELWFKSENDAYYMALFGYDKGVVSFG